MPSVDQQSIKRKTQMLRDLLTPKSVVVDSEAAKKLPFYQEPPATARKIEFIMEAHNGLSAKIVQQAGFKGIWASGLSISAALGVRDNNEGRQWHIISIIIIVVIVYHHYYHFLQQTQTHIFFFLQLPGLKYLKF
jgi:hypothetical protein